MTKNYTSRRVVRYTWHSTINSGFSQQGHYRIAVIGVGEAGNSTIEKMKELGTLGAECTAINTDALHLNAIKAPRKELIGERLTRELSVGYDPKLGQATINESRERIEELLASANIVFVTANLGEDPRTSAAPVVAEIARRNGAVTVGVVTVPSCSGDGWEEHVASALTEMKKNCDTTIVIDNKKLVRRTAQMPAAASFGIADRMLAKMIRDVVEAISAPSLINVDVADFRTMLKKGGMAVVSLGESDAPNRAEQAVRSALTNPLLDVDCAGATGAMIDVIGDNQMTIEEANRVGEMVTEVLDSNAMVIWSARVNPQLQGLLKVTLVMTGVDSSRLFGSMDKIAPDLYNMEPFGGSEEALDVRLDLYQMEKC